MFLSSHVVVAEISYEVFLKFFFSIQTQRYYTVFAGTLHIKTVISQIVYPKYETLLSHSNHVFLSFYKVKT